MALRVVPIRDGVTFLPLEPSAKYSYLSSVRGFQFAHGRLHGRIDLNKNLLDHEAARALFLIDDYSMTGAAFAVTLQPSAAAYRIPTSWSRQATLNLSLGRCTCFVQTG
jgi:hypothetical protein